MPSSWIRTPLTAFPTEAETSIVTVPVSSLPSAGDSTATVGAVVSGPGAAVQKNCSALVPASPSAETAFAR